MSINTPEVSKVAPFQCPDNAPRTEATKFYPNLPDNLAIANQWIGQLFNTPDNLGRYSVTLTKVGGGEGLGTKLSGTLVLLSNGQLRIGNTNTSEIVKMSLEKIELTSGMKTVYYIHTVSGSKYMLQDWKLN